ncbi:MAG TPA: SPFH domain-containing protein [Longimicrobiales bacterium]|nr:SPFH domain-containing protein [Longimicrobiales bacterium]
MTIAMLAALQSPLDGIPTGMVLVGSVALILFSLFVLFVSRYKRCPANRVLVISGQVGTGQSARVISGGGAFVWPVIQQADFLSLLPLQIDINLMDALSLENIRVRVPSQVTVAIGDTEEYQQNAAARVLGVSPQEVAGLAMNIIFGQMRQVIASMKIEDINRDRDQFRANIEHALEPELKKIGLKLINVNIKDLNDESGYIEAIGREAGARAVQKARGDVAVQEKLGEIAVASATQEKEIAVADANRTREIGVKSAARDTAVKIAELDRETAVAQKQAEFQRDSSIARADQERRITVAAANAEAIKGESAADQERRIAIADANAQAIEGETLAQAKVADAKAALQVREAEAYEIGETRKRVAQAKVQETENRALALAAGAEAERIEALRRAELEAPAKAERAKRLVEAEAEAQSLRIEAEGEAAAIFARLEAEARGEYEKLAKKAEGLGRIVEACGGADQAYQLLMLEHLDHLAETTAQAISSIKLDKVVVWGGGNGTGGSDGVGVGAFVRDLAGSVPPVMQMLRDIGGVRISDRFVTMEEDVVAAAANTDDGTKVEPADPRNG